MKIITYIDEQYFCSIYCHSDKKEFDIDRSDWCYYFPKMFDGSKTKCRSIFSMKSKDEYCIVHVIDLLKAKENEWWWNYMIDQIYDGQYTDENINAIDLDFREHMIKLFLLDEEQ